LGKHFTVGLDLKDSQFPEGDDAARLTLSNRKHVLDLQESFTAMERCPQPVILAVHGAAIGGGVDLSCAADIRLCSKQAWFCIKEVDVGLAADVGTLQRLHHVLGNASLARELCYTARRFPAEEALRAGFVSAVYDTREELLAKAREMAQVIASKSPVAVHGTKVHLNFSREHTLADSLEYMSTWNGAMLQASDVMVAMQAAFNKGGGPPTFSKL
jgi:delta(3,5)-delta(2,4)-dienoyl-CoA isomerase